MANWCNCWRVAPKIRPILSNFWHSTLSLAQQLEKPYPFWHTFAVQNPILSGTLLENPTLCGTEVGQNGTLAVLAYAYCRQWECPPRAEEAFTQSSSTLLKTLHPALICWTAYHHRLTLINHWLTLINLDEPMFKVYESESEGRIQPRAIRSDRIRIRIWIRIRTSSLVTIIKTSQAVTLSCSLFSHVRPASPLLPQTTVTWGTLIQLLPPKKMSPRKKDPPFVCRGVGRFDTWKK